MILRRHLRPSWIRACALLLLVSSCSDPRDTTLQADSIITTPGQATSSVQTTEDPLVGEVLADGDVSVAELERYVAVVEACIRTQGFPNVKISLDLPWSVGVSVGGGGAGQPTDASGALDQCQGPLQRIQDTYFQLHGPNPEQKLRRQLELVNCLQKANYSVNTRMDTAELNKIVKPGDLYKCTLEAERIVR